MCIRDRLHSVLEELKTHVRPGVTTMQLDAMAEKMIRDAGAVPSFKGFEGFPSTLCTSIDDQVVHGFPDDTPPVSYTHLDVYKRQVRHWRHSPRDGNPPAV